MVAQVRLCSIRQRAPDLAPFALLRPPLVHGLNPSDAEIFVTEQSDSVKLGKVTDVNDQGRF
jgi:hypothetical protein